MTIPNRIWLQWYEDPDPIEDSITWSSDKISDDDVEYVRVGSLIEFVPRHAWWCSLLPGSLARSDCWCGASAEKPIKAYRP